MKNQNQARFRSDVGQYTPHSVGVTYTNENLTDGIARSIIKNDPDAAGLFETLPAEAAEGEDELAQVSQQQVQAAASQPSAQLGLSDNDLDRLADKIMERMRATVAGEEQATEQHLEQRTQEAEQSEAEKLHGMTRGELNDLYSSEVPESDPKQFANKDLLIEALVAYRAGQSK